MNITDKDEDKGVSGGGQRKDAAEINEGDIIFKETECACCSETGCHIKWTDD